MEQSCLPGLERIPSAPHAHECPKCSYLWAHDSRPLVKEVKDNPSLTDAMAAQYERAHTCPECGADQHWVYQGHRIPQIVHDGSGEMKSMEGCPTKFIEEDKNLRAARKFLEILFSDEGSNLDDLR